MVLILSTNLNVLMIPSFYIDYELSSFMRIHSQSNECKQLNPCIIVQPVARLMPYW